MTNEKNEQILIKSLTNQQVSTIALISADTDKLKDSLKTRIKELLPEYEYIDFSLVGRQFTSINALLCEHLPQEVIKGDKITHVINISGLDDFAIDFKDNKIVPSPVIEQMNFERERFYRNINAILIFYVNNYTIEKLQQTAPDFWDWVLLHHFNFTTPDEEKHSDGYVEDENYHPQPYYSPERLKKIKELEHKLSSLDASQKEEMRYIRSKLSLQQVLAEEYYHVREFEKANKLWYEILTIRKKIGLEKIEEAEILFELAYNYCEMRKFKTALDKFNASLDLFMQIGNKSSYGTIYHNIGSIYKEQRQWTKALENYQKALNLSSAVLNFRISQ